VIKEAKLKKEMKDENRNQKRKLETIRKHLNPSTKKGKGTNYQC
jgi:hypothetical protein